MRNDLQIKVTLLKEKGKNKIYLDYYNRELAFVGNIIVDETGKMEWHIINAKYQENIIPVALYINDNYSKVYLDYESNNVDKRRWNRLISYIMDCGYYLNFKSYSNQKKMVKR